MSKNVLLISGIVIVVIIAIVFFVLQTDPTEAPTVEEDELGLQEESEETGEEAESQPEISEPTEEESEPSPEQEEPSPLVVSVTYTSAGFSPSTVTVPVGSVVTFRNESSTTMWIASDPHPTHDNLSGFESFSVSPGQSYQFTFNATGSWGYHDHLRPHLTGTVIVQ